MGVIERISGHLIAGAFGFPSAKMRLRLLPVIYREERLILNAYEKYINMYILFQKDNLPMTTDEPRTGTNRAKLRRVAATSSSFVSFMPRRRS